MSTTVNVCPERASGDSPFRGASSHVTDCRWLGRRGVRVSTSVHRGPRPEHMVQKAVHRLGSATQRPESSVVLQTDPVGCCPHSKNGGRSGGAGRAIHRPGTHHGSCSSAFPGQALGSLFANQVGVRLLPSRANLRAWCAGLTPQTESWRVYGYPIWLPVRQSGSPAANWALLQGAAFWRFAPDQTGN